MAKMKAINVSGYSQMNIKDYDSRMNVSTIGQSLSKISSVKRQVKIKSRSATVGTSSSIISISLKDILANSINKKITIISCVSSVIGAMGQATYNELTQTINITAFTDSGTKNNVVFTVTVDFGVDQFFDNYFYLKNDTIDIASLYNATGTLISQPAEEIDEIVINGSRGYRFKDIYMNDLLGYIKEILVKHNKIENFSSISSENFFNSTVIQGEKYDFEDESAKNLINWLVSWVSNNITDNSPYVYVSLPEREYSLTPTTFGNMVQVTMTYSFQSYLKNSRSPVIETQDPTWSVSNATWSKDNVTYDNTLQSLTLTASASVSKPLAFYTGKMSCKIRVPLKTFIENFDALYPYKD